MSNFSTFLAISVGMPNCIMQSELQESERALESLKVGAEQQKQTADVECDTTQVFYIVYISYVLLYVYANVCASVCM